MGHSSAKTVSRNSRTSPPSQRNIRTRPTPPSWQIRQWVFFCFKLRSSLLAQSRLNCAFCWRFFSAFYSACFAVIGAWARWNRNPMPFRSSKPFSIASSSSSSSSGFSAAGLSLVPCELLVVSVCMRVFVFPQRQLRITHCKLQDLLDTFSAGVILEERPEMLRRPGKLDLVTHSKEHIEECACHMSGKQCQNWPGTDRLPCSAQVLFEPKMNQSCGRHGANKSGLHPR